jgi:hypothetical protein
MADQQQGLRRCACALCQPYPQGAIAREHRAVNRVLAALDERSRRLLAGLLASQRGHGGIERLAQITGLSRTTIRRGRQEIDRADAVPRGRVRRPGGGRPRAGKKSRPS